MVKGAHRRFLIFSMIAVSIIQRLSSESCNAVGDGTSQEDTERWRGIRGGKRSQ